MKKQIFVLAFLASILQGTCSFASILLVKEYGVNNTYTGIQLALNAAANNDTIVVYDKPSGQNWIENITISKNIFLMHPTDGVRFKLFGSITIVPKAGMDLYLVGYDLSNNQIITTTTGATATATDRAKITISNCQNITAINLNQDWIDARIFYNTVGITGNITFRHGFAIGNVLATDAIVVNPEATTAAQSDSILIIGNKMAYCGINTYEAGLIANNYMISTLSYGLRIYLHNPSANAIFGIYNNSITASTFPIQFMLVTGASNTNVRIVNNLLSAPGSTSIGINGDLSNGSPSFISHNYLAIATATYSVYSYNNELNYQTASATNYGTIDTWGRAASGNTLLVDKGNYLGEFYDINLTRNDIGTYGGPYTIDNYISTSTSKASVLYVNMPHTLTNINQLINVKASAGSKF